MVDIAVRLVVTKLVLEAVLGAIGLVIHVELLVDSSTLISVVCELE